MMSQRLSVCLGVTALAVAALLVAAEPASAQRWGWGGRGYNAGYSPWTGFSSEYGSPYYGSPYGGYGWGNYGYGWGNSPWYSGNQNYYGWNTWGNYPGYSGTGSNYAWQNYPSTQWYTPGTEWSGNEYAQSSPSYYSEGMNEGMQGQNAGFAGGQGYGGQAYGAMSGGMMDNRVLITLRVPPNAQVWFDDQKTTETGMIRSYISPPLNSDRNFVYQVRVHWTQNGKPVDRTRRIEVHAGDHLFVNLMPASQGMGGSNTGQYGTSNQSGGAYGTSGNPETAPAPSSNTNRNMQTPNENLNPPPTRPANQPATAPPANRPQGTTPR